MSLRPVRDEAIHYAASVPLEGDLEVCPARQVSTFNYDIVSGVNKGQEI